MSTTSGIALVATHEFRIRLRTGRWRWLLGSWVVVVGVFTVLMRLSLSEIDENRPYGVPMFGCLMLFVLALAMIVSPTLTAQSINGDRERGTLATLQVTRLTPTQIALGKLLAAWSVGVAALLLTLPFVVWCLIEGGINPLAVLAVFGVVAVLIGVVCAVSQAISALLARSITSALLSYVVMFALTVGTVIVFSLATALSAEQHTPGGDIGSYRQERPDHVWWLLAPNPFVVLADATPQLDPTYDRRTGEYRPHPFDPLGELGRGIRELREDPNTRRDYDDYEGGRRHDSAGRVWPTGLAVDLILGAGAVLITIRRLRIPSRALPKGVRVA
ncbi:MAG: ABC transporter permease [Mycobacteriaceae bacterium]|nr:ABC transporter permease [Mycobacteriaceae bacterium]